jgi:1-acyl-sn-glycerol-3-phosphate acyltransferase
MNSTRTLLDADLVVPLEARGVVLFAHGTRRSPAWVSGLFGASTGAAAALVAAGPGVAVVSCGARP